MKILKSLLLYSFLFFLFFIFVSTQRFNENTGLNILQQQLDTSKWIVPDSANALPNPILANEESIAEGKIVYSKNCRSCHGKLGNGKGAGGMDLKTKPSAFTTKEFGNQSDGSMFWKISEGRNDMESYKEELDKEEIWNVISYIKTFIPVE